MIDRVEMAAGDRQQVAGLPIGVVEDRVEHRDPAQSQVVAVDHVDDVRLGVGIDPLLEHALAVRSFAEQRGRDDAPPERLRHEVGRDLAPGQRPDREVEQRTLTDRRLPDGEQVALDELAAEDVRLRPGWPDPHDHRVVRRPDEPAEDLELAGPQSLDEPRGCRAGCWRAVGRGRLS